MTARWDTKWVSKIGVNHTHPFSFRFSSIQQFNHNIQCIKSSLIMSNCFDVLLMPRLTCKMVQYSVTMRSCLSPLARASACSNRCAFWNNSSAACSFCSDTSFDYLKHETMKQLRWFKNCFGDLKKNNYFMLTSQSQKLTMRKQNPSSQDVRPVWLIQHNYKKHQGLLFDNPYPKKIAHVWYESYPIKIFFFFFFFISSNINYIIDILFHRAIHYYRNKLLPGQVLQPPSPSVRWPVGPDPGCPRHLKNE